MSGRTINIAFYSSVVNATRAVDISNAMLNFNSYWDYRLSGKSISSAGSRITTVAMTSDGLIYPLADVTGLSGSVITGTNFGQLTFTNTSNTSLVTMEPAILSGSWSLKVQVRFQPVVIPSIHSFSPALRITVFAGTNTINKYMKAQSAACAGFSGDQGYSYWHISIWQRGDGGNRQCVHAGIWERQAASRQSLLTGANAGGNTGWTINVCCQQPALLGRRRWRWE